MMSPERVNIRHFSKDALVIRVLVLFDPDDAIQSLAGATGEAFAKTASGARVDGVVTIDVPNSFARATFAVNSLPAGQYDLEVALTVGGLRRTVVEGVIKSKASL